MTENEAIKIFNDLLDVPCEMLVKYDSVINSEKKQALVRLRTAEEIAISALEKQIPKKLINTCQYVSGCCPNCKKYISDWLEYNKFMCCPYCGQKLDWSE